MHGPPADILNAWALSVDHLVADTGHARVWKVRTDDGRSAALKLYRRPDRGNESAGTRLLQMWQSTGAVEILAETETAILMKWLDGLSLGDIARGGEPDKALHIFAETAARAHEIAVPKCAAWKPLTEVFQPLFACQFSGDCPPALKSNVIRACDLARHLLDSQTEVVPLHGDLHPDNVILTGAGPRVIDAKGYVGDKAFELANALRHPKGMPDLVRHTDQIENCLTLYSDTLNVSRSRLAQWAAAKCALSIFWRGHGVIGTDREADLLAKFLEIADQ